MRSPHQQHDRCPPDPPHQAGENGTRRSSRRPRVAVVSGPLTGPVIDPARMYTNHRTTRDRPPARQRTVGRLAPLDAPEREA